MKYLSNSIRTQLARHRGFTVVELLIVMAILILLAAVTLPSVKGLLKDQKISQGARVVQGFLESCKSRAIATGRPVACILDRNFLDGSGPGVSANDTVTRMSVGEVFPPYQGDWADAVVSITAHPTIPGRQVASLPLAQAASLWDSANSITSGLVSIDDFIQLGDSRRLYRIAEDIGVTTGTPPVLNIVFENPPIDPVNSLPLNNPAFLVPTVEPTIFPPTPMKFRIYRKPSKSMAGSITLPRGICVDLSVSGYGQSGRQFGAEAISGAAPAPAGYYGPVYIVFNASGKLQDLYYHTTVNGAHTSALRFPASGVVHLMVGKTEQVFSNPEGTATLPGYLSQTPIPSPAATVRDETTYNILDASNYWVSVNPYSGAIYSAQVQELANAPPGAATADGRTAQSRALAIYGVQRTDP